MRYAIYVCSNGRCRFRFPAALEEPAAAVCPRCRAAVQIVARPVPGGGARPDRVPDALPHVELLLDNLRSVYNVGAIFRTADGAGVRHLHLCGISATPEHPKLAKTALGADAAVAWTYHPNGVEAARQLKEAGYALWALEATPDATPLFDITREVFGRPAVLVAGNEVVGVDPGILALCERVLYLPMLGTKASLNVTIALGAAVYYLLHKG